MVFRTYSLDLCSEITSGGTQGTKRGTGEQTQTSNIQGKYLTAVLALQTLNCLFSHTMPTKECTGKRKRLKRYSPLPPSK